MSWIARQHYQCEFPSITTTCTIDSLASIMSVVLQDVPQPITTGAGTLTPRHHLRPRRRRSPSLKSPKDTKDTWSHHVKTRCHMPGGEGVVCDIKHHLGVRVKRGEPHTDNIDGHAEIVHHSKRKFVTSANYPGIRGRKPRTRRKKWFPLAGCKTICTMLDKHLLRAHQMKIGSVPTKCT